MYIHPSIMPRTYEVQKEDIAAAAQTMDQTGAPSDLLAVLRGSALDISHFFGVGRVPAKSVFV